MKTQFEKDNVLVPRVLKKAIFTVMAKDHIDLNATATMIHSHYHGTNISLLQYPSESNPGTSLDYSLSDDSASLSKKLQGLPKEYSEVNPLPFYTTTNNMYAPLCTISLPSYIENFTFITKFNQT